MADTMETSVSEAIEEEDEPMEMEIDETVPSMPIIENKRNSDDFLALMQGITANNEKPITVSSSPKPTTSFDSVAEKPTSEATVNDDDVEIIDVSLPKSAATEPTLLPPLPAIDDDDVVCIDDDEPKSNKPALLKRSVSVPVPDACEVIDLVHRKKSSINSKCINYACTSGKNLIYAPAYCLTFYRVKNLESKKHQVCRVCSELALQHFDNLVQLLNSNKVLVKSDIPIRNDLVEIEDSDSEEEVSEDNMDDFDSSNLEFLKENLDSCIKSTMEKYDLQGQCDKSVEYLKERTNFANAAYLELDEMVHDLRKRLDVIHHDLYAEFKVRYEPLPVLNVPDLNLPEANPSGYTIEAQSEEDRRNLRRTRPISYVELDDAASNPNSPSVGDRGNTTNDTTDRLEAIEISTVPADLPPKGPIEKPLLKIGELYYAARFLTVGSWVRVRLENILQAGSLVNGSALTQTMYCVFMENKQNSKYSNTRLISGKEIAYSFPSSVLLEVGTRVIAIFRETPTTGETKKFKREAFYPGIIAEPCSYTNHYRYLIFFDDGYAQYVEHKYVHLIYESSKDVWEDMHIDSRPFIKKYLESYPERPMVKLRKDQTVRTEYNGKWWLTTVMNIDCSLVQMFFEASSRIEWIYRGSTRLNPMFKEELAASNRQNKSRFPRQFNETGPYVQYTREPHQNQTQEQRQHIEPVRAVARKSTSRPIMLPNNKVQTVPFLPVGNNASNINVCTPPPSKVVYFTPRAQANTRTLYKEHTCSPKCKSFISYDVQKLKGYNPLSKPLLCGWNRITYRYRGKREINYKAPCGRFIRNMPELHRYLRLTQSEMTVDLFDFDFWVHCLAEFVLERNSTINKDMSGGLENVAIPVVNYVDSDINVFTNYSIKREPMEGVHLNLNSEFLCGCDCEDDCEDKSKCQCWQLTLQGLPYISKTTDADYVGYTYRRLPEPVITGIYECNSRCKCAKTCLNRVVQNPLQLKLQVFKTNNRGWGIRCLNDIPQGAFICIYAGSILTEQMANEGGKNLGDEYLAELDYIEVVEKMKEDYEDDVMEEESSRSDRKSRDESADEDDEEREDIARNNRKKSMEEDTDFVPTSLVPKGKDSSYKTRLRKRNEEDKSTLKPYMADKKKEEEECVTISDDEDTVREPSSFNPKDESNLADQPSKYKSVREMFSKDECIYVMDAKITGNIGRFLNHSCSPNVFVQNVFVDTHDVRFPWVAFFALTYIRAGTELTWNYNYDVGSVPGKVLYCHCASQECRGRLL